MKKMRILVTIVTAIALLLTTGNSALMAAVNSSSDYAQARVYSRNGPSPVDKNVLFDAIETAIANKASVTVSNSGYYVLSTSQWVTSTVMRNYTKSISRAQAVYAYSRINQTSVDNAVTALASATSAFNDAKAYGRKPAVAVDKTVLASTITAAQANASSVGVCTDGCGYLTTELYVTPTAKTAYHNAITQAQAVVDDAAATQITVDNAVTNLDCATSAFNDAKAYGKKTAVTVDKTTLIGAINAAQTNASSVEVSIDGHEYLTTELYVTPTNLTAYTNAITAAQAVVDDAAAIQITVDNAVKALASATSAFNDSKAYGKKTAVTVDKTILIGAINTAQTNAFSVGVSADGNDYLTNELYVTPANLAAYTNAITQAQAVVDDANAIQITVDNAVANLNNATSAFNAAKACGKKTATVTPPVIRADSFDGSLASFWKDETPKFTYSKQYTANPVADGTQSLRMELRRTDALVNGSTRCELAVSPLETPNEEHWYDISMYLPSDYIADNMPECIVQWHNYPDFDLGESWTSSPLYVYTRNGHYYLSRLWDDAPVSTNSGMLAKGYTETVDLGAYETGKWVDWSFHVKWGWLPSQDPILEVYKDGDLVVERNGLPNTTNDEVGVYNKIGIYKWGWAGGGTSSCDTRVIYYDNYVVR